MDAQLGEFLRRQDVAITQLRQENAALKTAAASDAEKIRELTRRLRDADAKAEQLVTVKKEVISDLHQAAGQVERVRGEKRKAEEQLEEQKESHEKRLQAHQEVQAKQAADLNAAREQSQCSICFERPVSHFYPCGHRICGECDEGLLQRFCPFDNQPIAAIGIRIF